MLRLLHFVNEHFALVNESHGCHSHCHTCNFSDVHVYNRRLQLSMKLFNRSKSTASHVLHDLVPPSSFHSERIVLPFVRTTHRAKDFFSFPVHLYITAMYEFFLRLLQFSFRRHCCIVFLNKRLFIYLFYVNGCCQQINDSLTIF